MALTPNQRFFLLRKHLTRSTIALDTKANQLTRSARASGSTRKWKAEAMRLRQRAEGMRVRSLVCWGWVVNENRLAAFCKCEGVPDDTRR